MSNATCPIVDLGCLEEGCEKLVGCAQMRGFEKLGLGDKIAILNSLLENSFNEPSCKNCEGKAKKRLEEILKNLQK